MLTSNVTARFDLSDRTVSISAHTTRSSSTLLSGSRWTRLDQSSVFAPRGSVSETTECLTVQYGHLSTEESQVATVDISTALVEDSNGYGLRLKLCDIEVDYLALGFVSEGEYHHIKAPHPPIDRWFDFGFGTQDLVWGWRNDWRDPGALPIERIRLFIKGKFRSTSRCDIAEAVVWKEEPTPNFAIADFQQPDAQLRKVLYKYQSDAFPYFQDSVDEFLANGTAPLAGSTNLEWDRKDPSPGRLEENGTYQYSWHALHPVTFLMLASKDKVWSAETAAARDFVTSWLDRSYYHPDKNLKFAWYDHGTAERLLSLLMVYWNGLDARYDSRFMTRLQTSLFRHGQILANEAFYGGHQASRYHNHAWFQDLALIVLSLAFPNWPCSGSWLHLAFSRLEDQFQKLIVDEGRYAVFAENSIGYHLGITTIVDSINQFVKLAEIDSDFTELVSKLRNFSALLTYPGGRRTPSQGDTFRLPNPSADDLPRPTSPFSDQQIGLELLPKAGYAVARGNHLDSSFVLILFATDKVLTHKHNDDLSIVFFFDGIEWLIDPSFYSHEYDAPIPAYLRGPNAHNALILPEAQYSIAPDHCYVEGNSTLDQFHVAASHTAAVDALIQRTISGQLNSLNLLVTDWLESDRFQLEDAKLVFQFGEHVSVEQMKSVIKLSHPLSKYCLTLEFLEDVTFDFFHGRPSSPVRGIAGQGFQQSMDITTLEVTPSSNSEKIAWKISAHDKQ
ncbi:hypothetical protein CGBL_0104400 [Corynebacterium glutamicum]|nr:hypothetical protein B5C28_02200 [Corynebacterium glutamicum]BAV22188.1 hypothetical protein CGBL_0104400 [Corynebacterium glutamicum]